MQTFIPLIKSDPTTDNLHFTMCVALIIKSWWRKVTEFCFDWVWGERNFAMSIMCNKHKQLHQYIGSMKIIQTSTWFCLHRMRCASDKSVIWGGVKVRPDLAKCGSTNQIWDAYACFPTGIFWFFIWAFKFKQRSIQRQVFHVYINPLNTPLHVAHLHISSDPLEILLSYWSNQSFNVVSTF